MTELAAIRKLVDDYIQVSLCLMAPPSPCGQMLEALRDEMIGKPDDTGLWRRSLGQESRTERRARLYFPFRGLHEPQRKAIILMRMPLLRSEMDEDDSPQYIRIERHLLRPDEEFLCKAEAPVFDSELYVKHAAPALDYADCMIVQGYHLVYPSRAQVAKRMKFYTTEGEPDIKRVDRLLHSGYAIMRCNMATSRIDWV